MNALQPFLRTRRLLLRQWRDSDYGPFAAMNADPEVMEFFPALLSRAESDALAARIQHGFAERGFGLWAVEAPGVAPFLGFTGLSVPSFQAHFMPAVEIGWRFATQFWGNGYATEAAGAVLQYAFASLELAEVVSFTSNGNLRSRRVMERLGMTHDFADDFEYPGIAPGHVLRPHVLYRKRREAAS